ncbi:hypothetical protein [Desulfovibrio ferrophilus]|uniref:Lipoprotein n=1 Tax=Desulfovibrio ferrophilus TaxID=241368 RepID=A0A2Z6AY13_9BACT|nr:hypothetical protein [Desulfovibrio ferrophilus]BBD08108.1 putative uncharacterized protein [Desulfovibrio ferrophilus]
MRNTVLFCLTALLALSMAAGLISCKTAGSKPAKSTMEQASPQKATDPMQDLSKRMFILDDGRDMRLVIIRMGNQGMSAEQLQAYARRMTLADFEKYVEQKSEAKRLVYIGAGQFRLDAMSFDLGSERFKNAQMFMKLKNFEIEGHKIDGIILDRVILDGRDFTDLASLKIYRGVLEMMARQ